MTGVTNFPSLLIKADTFCDYVPVLSTISNLVDLFQKYVIVPILTEKGKENHYYKHIKEKSSLRSIALLVPMIGNICIAIFDIPSKKKVLFLIKKFSISLKRFTKFQDEKEVVLAACQNGGLELKFASEKLKNDKDVVKLAISKSFYALNFASESLKDDKEIVLSALKQHGGFQLKFASEKLKQDQEVVKAAMNTSIFVVGFADEASKKGMILNYTFVHSCPPSEFVNGSLKSDMVNASSMGSTVFIGKDFKNDKDFVLAIVNHHGYSLKFVSENLRNDKEVVLAAVKNDGNALQYASDPLRNDKEVVTAALKQNVMALEFVSENLKKDLDFIKKII